MRSSASTVDRQTAGPIEWVGVNLKRYQYSRGGAQAFRSAGRTSGTEATNLLHRLRAAPRTIHVKIAGNRQGCQSAARLVGPGEPINIGGVCGAVAFAGRAQLANRLTSAGPRCDSVPP